MRSIYREVTASRKKISHLYGNQIFLHVLIVLLEFSEMIFAFEIRYIVRTLENNIHRSIIFFSPVLFISDKII